jgi:hypothetical protein
MIRQVGQQQSARPGRPLQRKQRAHRFMNVLEDFIGDADIRRRKLRERAFGGAGGEGGWQLQTRAVPAQKIQLRRR